jgi:hypothetical protein
MLKKTMMLSSPYEISMRAMEYDIIIPERIGENKSTNPKITLKMPKVSIHPHKSRPLDLTEKEPTMRITPEDITHTAKITGKIETSAVAPRPNSVQTANRVDRIPLASIQLERYSFSSLQKEAISEIPDISMEIPIKIARVTRFSRGVNSMVIPSITTRTPDSSSIHFIDLNIFLIIKTPLSK